MIRECTKADFKTIQLIINDAATAYKNTIPVELYREPWMSEEYLTQEISRGVKFYGFDQDNVLLGIMGIQNVKDITLIRHSYVKTTKRRTGIGSKLLEFHKSFADRPVLVGCLKAMTWAINFYQKHGFILVSDQERDILREKYWDLSLEHVRNSVVLVDEAWLNPHKSV